MNRNAGGRYHAARGEAGVSPGSRPSGFVPVIALALAALSLPARAQPSLHEQSRLLGNPLSILQQADAVNGVEPGTQRLQQETRVELLGQPVSVMKVGMGTAAGAPATPATAVDGPVNPVSPVDPVTPADPSAGAPAAPSVSEHEFYVGGFRVWGGRFHYDKGALMYSGGVAPTQIPVPLVVYPLGPVLLSVEAGVEFEGLVSAKVMGGPSYPLRDSTLHADLTADLYAAAYLEAYARLLFVKAGLGGRIDVINASTGFQSVFYLNGMKPRLTHYGYAQLLSGQVYGFVDFKLFLGRWSRLLGHTFFNWRGKVFNLGPKVDSIEW